MADNDKKINLAKVNYVIAEYINNYRNKDEIVPYDSYMIGWTRRAAHINAKIKELYRLLSSEDLDDIINRKKLVFLGWELEKREGDVSPARIIREEDKEEDDSDLSSMIVTPLWRTVEHKYKTKKSANVYLVEEGKYFLNSSSGYYYIDVVRVPYNNTYFMYSDLESDYLLNITRNMRLMHNSNDNRGYKTSLSLKEKPTEQYYVATWQNIPARALLKGIKEGNLFKEYPNIYNVETNQQEVAQTTDFRNLFIND